MALSRRPAQRRKIGSRSPETTAHKHSHALLDAATAAGAAAGAALGAIAGPPGIVAGGLLGTAIGGLAGIAATKADRAHEQHDHELDDAIGVTKGSLGAAPADRPPATRGNDSGASAGASAGAATSVAEGPMQDRDDDT